MFSDEFKSLVAEQAARRDLDLIIRTERNDHGLPAMYVGVEYGGGISAYRFYKGAFEEEVERGLDRIKAEVEQYQQTT